jgi:ketosteroid isomerase-like protein
MFCPNCGKEIGETTNFCQYCGFKMVSTQNLTVEDLIRNVLIQRIDGLKNRDADAIDGVVYREKYTKFDDWPPYELQESEALASEAKALKVLKEYEYETRSWKTTMFGDSATATFIIKYRGKMRDLDFYVQSRVSAFLTKINGEWKLVHEHWSRFPPQILMGQPSEAAKGDRKEGPIVV